MAVSSPPEHSPVLAALRESPIPALRKLAVEEADGTVVISGNVSSYYLKQLAQETVLHVLEDGRRLCNRVAVVRPERVGAGS